MSGLSNTDIGFTASGKTDAIKSERGIIKGQRTALFVLAALIPALVVLLMGTIIWISLEHVPVQLNRRDSQERADGRV
jgi:hypothetical protein